MLATIAYVDHSCAVCDTIFSTDGKFRPILNLRSYTVKTFGLLQPYFGCLSCMPVVYM